MAEDALSQRIINFIKRQGNACDTTQIVHGLKLPKKTINRSLYALQNTGVVVKIRDRPPMWKFSEVRGRGFSGARRRGREDRGRSSRRGTRGRGNRSSTSLAWKFQDSSVDRNLAERILNFLQSQNRGMTARDISVGINHYDITSINSQLYGMERLGELVKTVRTNNSQPLWSPITGNIFESKKEPSNIYFGDGGGYSSMLSNCSSTPNTMDTEEKFSYPERGSSILDQKLKPIIHSQDSRFVEHSSFDEDTIGVNSRTPVQYPASGAMVTMQNTSVESMDSEENKQEWVSDSVGNNQEAISSPSSCDSNDNDLAKVLRAIYSSSSLHMTKKFIIKDKCKLERTCLDDVLKKAMEHKYVSEEGGIYVLEEAGADYINCTLSTGKQGNSRAQMQHKPCGDSLRMSLQSSSTPPPLQVIQPFRVPQQPLRARGRASLLAHISNANSMGAPGTARGSTNSAPPRFQAPMVHLVQQQLQKTDLSDSELPSGKKIKSIADQEFNNHDIKPNVAMSSSLIFNSSATSSSDENLSNHHSLAASGPSSLSTSHSHHELGAAVDLLVANKTLCSASGPSSLPVQFSRSLSRSLNDVSGLELELTKESLSAVNKNPVSAFMEYGQSRHQNARIEVLNQSGPSHKPKFVMAAFLGDEKLAQVSCSNKKDGRKEVADLAMRTLIASGKYSTQSSLSAVPKAIPVSQMTHFDKVAALTHQQFNNLVANIADNFAGRKVVAGLVMQTSEHDVGIVIAVGSGNRCITGEQLSLEGNTVNDSHAEIITRRGFMRFLYKKLLLHEPNKSDGFFQKSFTSNKLRIRDGIKFHLYISTAPCGDGALFSPRDVASHNAPLDTLQDREHHPTFTSQAQGLLRTKMEGGEGTIPVEANFSGQSFDGILRGERLRTMSCTDKICRWNVVGMQGALLSHFLEPIYLDSLTLGFLFDPGHLARAVCCRVSHGDQSIDKELPSNYHLNHPWLGRVTAVEPSRETQKTKALSINWCLGDERAEVTDGTKGLCYTGIEKGFFSRCTKKNMYDSFKHVCEKFGRQELLEAKTYNEAKNMATDFVQAKNVMLRKFKENSCGIWVSKPVEEEMFA